jgi:hypothetical protein
MNNSETFSARISEHSHAQVINFVETKTKNKNKYVRVYSFSLLGIGLTPKEIKQKLRMLGIRHTYYKTPALHAQYNPYTIPRQLAEIVYHLSLMENAKNGKFKTDLFRRLRILGLLWHKYRLDYAYQRETKPISVHYFKKYAKGNINNIINDIKLLEKWGFITVNRQYHKISNYRLIIDLEKVDTFPLILTEPGYEYWPKSSGRKHSILMSQEEALCLLNGMKNHQTGNLTKIRRRKYNKPLYQIYKDGKEVAKKVDELMVKGIQYIDKMTDQEILSSRLNDPAWKFEKKYIQNLLANGRQKHFEYIRSGRRKGNKLPNQYTASQKDGVAKCTYFQSIKVPLYSVDLKSAELLAMAILSGDKQLLEDVCYDDVYNLARIQCNLFNVRRDDIKSYIIAKGYGLSTNGFQHFKQTEKVNLEEADVKLIDQYWKERYSTMEKYKWKLYAKAKLHIKIRKPIILFNSFEVTIEKGNEYTLYPLLMQSVVAYLNNHMFMILHEKGFMPLFERHDEVITREPVDFSTVNKRMIMLVNNLLADHQHQMRIDNHAILLKTKRIKTSPILYQNISA